MDLAHHGKPKISRKPLRSFASSHALGQPPTTSGLVAPPPPRSTPLPQNQWVEMPGPYRPGDWIDTHDQLLATVPQRSDTQYIWPLQPQQSERPSGRSKTTAGSKRRWIQRGLRDIVGRNNDGLQQEQSVDVAMLYPQMSPYDGRHSSYSAPDEMEFVPRNVSGPSSPNYLRTEHLDAEPLNLQIPRSPTYPPAGRRRMHSASGVQDAAFADEEEYRLFVEATVGLGFGQDQASRPSILPQQPLNPQHQQRFRHSESTVPRATSSHDDVSPLADTPTTMRALTELAQMPQGSNISNRQRLQTSASGLDLWIQPPSATSPNAVATASALPYRSMPSQAPASAPVYYMDDPINHLINDQTDDLIDDELPDYAESQAQAQAATRAEATRRAQELQRRWRETGARRGAF